MNSSIRRDTIGTDKYGNNFIVKMTNNGSLVWHKFLHRRFTPIHIPYSGGGNASEFFVAKADVDGNFKWVTAFNANYTTWGLGVKAYQDNIYTCGTHSYQLTTLGHLNGASSTTGNYKIFSGKLKDQYIRVGAITPTALIPGCTVAVPFTSYGLTFSAKNKFFAELSNANGDFSSVTTIGYTTSTGTGAITARIPATLTYSSGYRIRIRSSDTLATGYHYYAYADTGYALSLVCPPPSSGFTATNITGTSATLNWIAVSCAAAAFASAIISENISASTKDFSIYPNPATPAPNITAQIKLTGKATIRITDMAGKMLYQQTIQSSGKSINQNTNISKLSPGAYIVELITGNEVQNGKFIKE